MFDTPRPGHLPEPPRLSGRFLVCHRRAPDLLDRDFTAGIVGWQAATIKDTAMVTSALTMALW
ncbi:hypothetical protein [Nocardia gipuzkoensis]|uniref:hypothetical protein n=1 Tax=Nocardia gipuzkoensis TaxID=2749991 RepID=UPI0015EE3991|nr:hypothetical protein [Nocardia gipuzkoensis]